MGKFFNWGGSAAESAARVATMDARKAIEDCYKAIEEMKKTGVTAFNDLSDVKDSEIRIDGNKLVFEKLKTVDGETIREYVLELSAQGVELSYQDGGDHYATMKMTQRFIELSNNNDKRIRITPYGIEQDGVELNFETLLDEFASFKERLAALEGNNE